MHSLESHPRRANNKFGANFALFNRVKYQEKAL